MAGEVYYDNGYVRVSNRIFTVGNKQYQISLIRTMNIEKGEMPSWGGPAFGMIISGMYILGFVGSIILTIQGKGDRNGILPGLIFLCIMVPLFYYSTKALFTLRPYYHFYLNKEHIFYSKDVNQLLEIKAALNAAIEYGD